MTDMDVLTTHKRNRARNIPIETDEAIRALLGKGRTASGIHKFLERHQEELGLPGPLPDVRTIQRRVKELAPADPSEPWDLLTDETGDPRLILDTLEAVIRETEGRVGTISREVAEALMRLSRAAPDLEPRQRWVLANRYVERRERDETTEDLDALLAFTPWRSDEHDDKYIQALTSGWIVQAPISVRAEFMPDSVRDAILTSRPQGAEDTAELGWVRRFRETVQAQKEGVAGAWATHQTSKPRRQSARSDSPAE